MPLSTLTAITAKTTWLPLELHNTQAINPLVGAAAPLLTIAYQLSEQTQPLQDIKPLINTLTNELKHFYHKAHHIGYESKHILAARYWLCATLDELILNLPNPEKIQPPSLLELLQHPTTQQHFFHLIAEYQQAAHPSSDLLELAYICLCTGFTGNRDNANLNTIRNDLHQQTQTLRRQQHHTTVRKRSKFTTYATSAIILITVITLIGLHNSMQLKLKPLQTMLQTTNYNSLTQHWTQLT